MARRCDMASYVFWTNSGVDPIRSCVGGATFAICCAICVLAYPSRLGAISRWWPVRTETTDALLERNRKECCALRVGVWSRIVAMFLDVSVAGHFPCAKIELFSPTASEPLIARICVGLR